MNIWPTIKHVEEEFHAPGQIPSRRGCTTQLHEKHPMFWRTLRISGSGLLMVIIVLLSGLFSRLGLSRPASALARVGARLCRGQESLFYSELAMIHERAGNTSEAVAALREAIEREHDEGALAFYYFELGTLY